MSSKNSSPKLKDTSKNIATSTEKNDANDRLNTEGNASNYVSGDSARSSSSHQFHKS